MNGQQDLKQLLAQLAKLTSAIESQSAAAGGYQVRSGRGGNSNQKIVGGSANEEAIKRAEDNLEKAMRANGKASDSWVTAMRHATGMTKLFGETTKQTMRRIEAENSVQSEATREVTRSMIDLVKQHGLQSNTIKGSNALAFKYNDAMKNLIDKHSEMKSAEEERNEINKQISDAQQKLAGKLGGAARKQLKLELAQMVAARDSIKTTAEFTAEIQQLQDNMILLGKNIDKDTIPAFRNLSATTQSVIDAQGNAIISVDDLTAAFEETTPLVSAQGNATRRLTNDVEALSGAMVASRKNIAAAMLAIGKTLISGMGKSVDYYREQLKYNVDQSNYIAAQNMGMSDGELSKVLGTNVEAFRGMTGSARNTEVIDNGMLKSMQNTALKYFGEAGAEGAERAAQIARISQGSGINLRNNPEVVNQRIAAFSEMADRIGMVKGELVDFHDQLVQSGDMAVLAMKYNGLSAKAQAEAMDREIAARLLNAKYTGISNEQLKARIQYERSQQFGTLENMIKGQIGAAMEVQVSRDMGMTISDADAKLLDDYAQGMLTDQASKDRAANLKLAMSQNMNKKQADARNRGDYDANYGIATYVQFTQPYTDTFGMDKRVEAEKAAQKKKGLFTTEENAKGVMPASYRGDGVSSANADSSRLIFDQQTNSLKQLYDGWMKDPLVAVAKNTGIMVGQLGIMIYQNRGMSQLMGGKKPGGGGGWGGKVGGMSRLGRLGAGLGIGLLGAGAAMAGDYVAGDAPLVTNKNQTIADIADRKTAGAALGIGGAALQGAAIGAILGPIGAAVGATAGTAYGVYENFDVIERNFNVLTHTVGEFFSPEKKLETERAEATRKREEAGPDPIPVKITGPEGDAIRSTSIDVSKQVGLSKAQLEMLNRAKTAEQTEASIQANMEAKMQNINATAQMYQDSDR